MRHWFRPDGEAVVGYVPAGGLWVVAGAPICPSAQLVPTVEAFEAAAARAGCQVCYFGAQTRLVEALAERRPMAQLLLGAQPVWDPRGWPAIVAGKASLRAQLARARNKGVAVTNLPAVAVATHPAVRRCLTEWLATRQLPPLHFLVEPDTLAVPQDRRVFLAWRGVAVVAYLVATPIPNRDGWLLEQVVRGHAAPNGTAELLIDGAMRALADVGAAYITLGVAPLSQRTTEIAHPQRLPVWAVLSLAQAHGQRLYNFAGLEAFKAKLQPCAWEPVYLLSGEHTISLRTLYAVAGAFAGAPPPVFLAHALVRAAAQALTWGVRRLRAMAR